MLNEIDNIIRYGSKERKIKYISMIQDSPISERLSKEYIEALSKYKYEVLNDESLSFSEKQNIIDTENELWNECAKISILSDIEENLYSNGNPEQANDVEKEESNDAELFLRLYWKNADKELPRMIKDGRITKISNKIQFLDVSLTCIAVFFASIGIDRWTDIERYFLDKNQKPIKGLKQSFNQSNGNPTGYEKLKIYTEK